MKTIGSYLLVAVTPGSPTGEAAWGELVAPIGAGRSMKQPGTQEPRTGWDWVCVFHSLGSTLHALAEDRFLPLAKIY